MTIKLEIEEAIDSAFTLASKTEAENVTPEGATIGRYDGLPVQFERSLEDRSGTLLRALTYFNSNASEDQIDANDIWAVPVGAWLDGASIPRPLWSIIGGPYTGKYFPASVVHDHYCIIKTRPWRETHRMFHSAMRTNRVGWLKAKIMFYAVYRFGPRWRVAVEEGGIEPEGTFIEPETLDDSKAISVYSDMSAIIEKDMSLEAIEALAQSH